ncbi:MAG: aminotransferase class I/II-fold pyridoxal phosphate-dependent enzyme [Acidobacteria bacterium]|nr:aminotransferase class I/II-fold pyridoxal phosphate-dependent enzyme [Acidobacteriota bacterium]
MIRRPALSSRLAPFGTTIFTEMTRLAEEHGAVNLAQGFPDFDGPEFAREAAVEAIRGGLGQYARMAGLPDLVRALSLKYERDYGLFYDPMAEITVTSGATETLFAAIHGITEPGDEIVLFEPYYDSYRASVAMAGAVPRFVALEAPDFRFGEGALLEACSEKTRAILVNSPHNPTGRVFSREELEAIARVAEERDLYVITDEVYEHLVYEGRHIPFATLPGMRERTILISSFGKTFSLTGWKIGWACAPPALSAAVRAAHQFVTFATATPLQKGAAVALSTGPAFYEGLTREYRERRDFLVGALREIGFDVTAPEGTYFACARFGAFGFDDDVAFARHLVSKIGVAVIPPSVFYEHTEKGKGYVRFAFCKKRETLERGIDRLRSLTRI